MIRYELKKISNVRLLFCFLLVDVVCCFMFWTQNRGVEKAKNTEVMQSIYNDVGGEITDANAEKIEALKKKKDNIIGRESAVEKEYNEGKIGIDDYMEYRDEYHFMYNRSDAIDLIYEKYLENQKRASWMLFDGYYNQLFQPERNQWGLILSVFLMTVLLSCCEPVEFAYVIRTTKKGKLGVWQAKLKTSLILSVIITILYTIEEYCIMESFSPIAYLDAPVQSISCLSDISLSVSIGQWISLTIAMRILFITILSGVLCTVLYYLKNKKAGILITVCILFIPMILSEVFQLDKYNILSKWITVYSLFI